MKTITLVYVTNSVTEREITIKDFSFRWEQLLWGDDKPSITGARRNRFRAYQPVLTLEFEHDDQLRTVAEEVHETLKTGTVFFDAGEFFVSVVPEEFTSSHNYKSKIRRKPSMIVFKGDLTDGSELTLDIRLVGGTSHTGDVIAKWKTTKPAESKIYWGLDADNLDQTMVYNGDFQTEHEITFPVSFVGSLHYFRAWSRESGGTEVSSEVVGIYFILGEFEVEAVLFAAATLQVISVTSLQIEHGGFTVSINEGPNINPKPGFSAEKQSLSAPAPLLISGSGDGFSVNVNAVIT